MTLLDALVVKIKTLHSNEQNKLADEAARIISEHYKRIEKDNVDNPYTIYNKYENDLKKFFEKEHEECNNPASKIEITGGDILNAKPNGLKFSKPSDVDEESDLLKCLNEEMKVREENNELKEKLKTCTKMLYSYAEGLKENDKEIEELKKRIVDNHLEWDYNELAEKLKKEKADRETERNEIRKIIKQLQDDRYRLTVENDNNGMRYYQIKNKDKEIEELKKQLLKARTDCDKLKCEIYSQKCDKKVMTNAIQEDDG